MYFKDLIECIIQWGIRYANWVGNQSLQHWVIVKNDLNALTVTKAGTTDVDKVRDAMAGQTFKAPSGFTLTMDATNHHLHKPVMIGEIEGNGQFNVVWQTDEPVRAQPWSPWIPGNDKKPDHPVKTVSQ